MGWILGHFLDRKRFALSERNDVSLTNLVGSELSFLTATVLKVLFMVFLVLLWLVYH